VILALQPGAGLESMRSASTRRGSRWRWRSAWLSAPAASIPRSSG